MQKAVLFPGQGAQYVGMGKDIFDAFSSARDVFQEVDDALSYSLSKIIFEGDEETLKKTEFAQAALMTTSMAFVRVIEKETGKKLNSFFEYTAGHSLGEWTALVASNALSLSQGAKLLSLRGQFMQEASEENEGTMASIIGLSLVDVEEVIQNAKEKDVLLIANDNSIGQIVISGQKEAVQRAMTLAKEKGAKLTIPLAVSGAFHSPLMQKAADKMEEALLGVDLKEPTIKLIENTTADVMEKVEEIRKVLVLQITGRVRFTESVQKMKELGVEKVVEIGAGKVLTGLVRRIETSLEKENVSSLSQLDSFLNENG
ncbi:MAG: ACP S-malonyltransferase [Alphaproteobacteria bacterium]|nr:ACP S-malonyltransferase [Alphaproteobacteria bacterium]